MMKKIFLLLIAFLSFSLYSCGPAVFLTTYIDRYKDVKLKEEVKVIYENQDFTGEHEVLAKIDVGDSGFTMKGSFEVVITRIKEETKKLGGNAIKILKHRRPDFISSCHRIEAYIIKLKDPKNIKIKQKVKQDPNTKTHKNA